MNLKGTQFSKGVAMQATADKPMRRIVKSFAIRLDLLEKLEAEAPKGERSAFLELSLIHISEPTRPY